MEGDLMNKKVYVSGHKVPDTDSIASAISYAYLVNSLGKYDAKAVRLGDLNKETKFVLKHFGVDEPKLLTTMKIKLKDVDLDDAVLIDEDSSLYEAINLLREKNAYVLIVIDKAGKMSGIIGLKDITEIYTNIFDDTILSKADTPFKNVVEVLKGTVINDGYRKPIGRMAIYAMDPKMIEDRIEADDVVILGDREDAQEDAIKRNVSCMIVTGGFDISEKILNLAKEKGISIISTEYDSFMASRVLPLSVPVSYAMTKDGIKTFHIQDFVSDVKAEMNKNRFRCFPVLDNDGRVINTVSRYHLLDDKKKNIILVDHNERTQSVDDIEEAEILEIIDHHRVANVETKLPLYFRNEPLGSTATIITKMFIENGVVIPKHIAGLLISAIISDTLLLKSPTSTRTDAKMIDFLAPIAGIDPDVYAIEMFTEAASIKDVASEDLLKMDVKSFNIAKKKIRVAQVMTMDMDEVKKRKDDLLNLMKETIEKNQEDSFVLMITDILKEYSLVLVQGSYKESVAAAFDKELVDNEFTVDGLLSRKKQMIPAISKKIETL